MYPESDAVLLMGAARERNWSVVRWSDAGSTWLGTWSSINRVYSVRDPEAANTGEREPVAADVRCDERMTTLAAMAGSRAFTNA